MNDDQDSGGELKALQELVASEGWLLFQKLVEAEWGAETTLQKIEQALAQVPRGDQDAINDTTQQIQTARREVRKVLAMPAEQIRRLSAAKPSKRPFAEWRRA